MIRSLAHNEIDKKKWDDAIRRSFNGMIYAYSWYLDIICPGWDALEKNNYEYVMPLTGGKKYGISYLYPPFFSQQLGIFSASRLDENITEEFLAAIPEKFRYVEINLNKFNKYAGTAFAVTKNINHELDLIHPYEKLFGNYSDNAQRNVKRSQKNELKIKKHVDISDVIRLFRSNRGREVNELKTKHYSILSDLSECCANHRCGEVWGVVNKHDELCAGALFVRSNGRVIFLFSGLSKEGKKLGAMFFLIDEFIRLHSEQNIIFDFEGSNNKDLARFYKSFGSKESVYLQVRKNALPPLLKWLKQ